MLGFFFAWLLALFRGPRAPPKPKPWPFAIQTTCILGETGSGKTSGSLATLLRTWLRSERPGAIFCCSKPDDARKYIAHCRAADRGKDVIHVTLSGEIGCDPLQVLFTYGWATPLSAERLLKQCIDLFDGAEKGGGHEFFEKWGSELRVHCIVLLLAAYNSCRIQWIRKFLDSLHYGVTDTTKGYAQETTLNAIDNVEQFPPAFQQSIEQAANFVTKTFVLMPEKQREGIRSTAVAGVNVLCSYPLNRLLELDSLHPRDAEAGGLIVVDLPALEGHSNRVFSALIRSVFETIWIARKAGGRKILSIVDEFHLQLLRDDPRRMSVAREACVFGVRLFQTLEVAQMEVGGQLSEELVKAFIEQAPLKVFHQLPVGKTSEYASKLAGEFKEILFGGGGGGMGADWDLCDDLAGRRMPTSQVSWSEQYRPCLPAWEIARFQRGGPPNFVTECVVIESGQQHRRLTLPQIFV